MKFHLNYFKYSRIFCAYIVTRSGVMKLASLCDGSGPDGVAAHQKRTSSARVSCDSPIDAAGASVVCSERFFCESAVIKFCKMEFIKFPFCIFTATISGATVPAVSFCS